MTPKQIAEDFFASNPTCSMLVISGQTFAPHGEARYIAPETKRQDEPDEYPQFIRHHVPTGRESIGYFTEAHIPMVTLLRHETLKRKMLELIDKWNHEMPQHWLYRLK